MIAEFLVHASTVEPLLGYSGRGQQFGPPTELACLVDDEARLVRTDSGAEEVASTTITYPPGTVVPVGSRVTVNGRVHTVLTSATVDDGGLTGLAHVEVTLR